MNRLIKIIFLGILGAFLLGIIGLFIGTLYGGNYGCFQIIDSIFTPLKGYESCGIFGFWFGTFIGIIISILIGMKLHKSKK